MATDDCTALGNALSKTARLVSITSSALELELLTLSGNSEFWTGGNDIATQKTFVWDLDGTEFWKDGVETGYNMWWKSNAATQPNHKADQDCLKFKVKMKSDGSGVEKIGWDDIKCAGSENYMCQYSIA